VAEYVIGPEKLEHILAQVSPTFSTRICAAPRLKNTRTSLISSMARGKAICGRRAYLVPSPKVATYDLKPEMSAAGITDTVVHAIEKVSSTRSS